MLNKKTLWGIIFSCLCVSAFPQDVPADRARAESFIDNFYWYQKYLPQENIAELYTFRDTLVFLKENNDDEFDWLSGALGVKIYDFDAKVFDHLRGEMIQKDRKLDLLLDRYGSDAELKDLSLRYADFKTIIAEYRYPENDTCLDMIETSYSQRITRLGYKLLNQRMLPTVQTYTTKSGDYFRKISADPSIYNEEQYWKNIYNANKTNSNLLPNPNNPDLMYPGVTIQIPPLYND